MSGTIFNIQKFSIHDGPGIRTTVFFKGCPLSCKWCANPESQSTDIQILYNKDKCCHCLKCVNSCPNKAITYKENKIIIDNKKCIGCLTCVNNCPKEALTHEGEYKEIQEIVDVCLQDKDFYEESGGGVTISGGEGMIQPIFLKKLIAELKKHDINLAIETTGYVEPDIFKDLATKFDLLLFDVKHYDSNKHLEGTGVRNELILSNLKWAINEGLNVLCRIPIIPEFNSSLEDADNLSNLLKSMNIKRAQLLPFHQFGQKKYEMLNKEYKYKDDKPLYRENLTEYQKIFLDKKIDCFF